MQKVILTVLILMSIGLMAEETIDLHFVVDPQLTIQDSLFTAQLVTRMQNDSIPSFRFVCGDIAKTPVSDSLVLAHIAALDADYASPTDYFFTRLPQDAAFDLLMSNVDADSVQIIDRAIITGDSLRIGVFALLTPDLEVLNTLDPRVDVRADVFATAARLAIALDASCNYVIMLSSMGKFIDADIVRGLPIDRVISFDYQGTGDATFNDGATKFNSVLLSKGLLGRLRLHWENGVLSDEWKYTRVK